jgi:hypothetical protein
MLEAELNEYFWCELTKLIEKWTVTNELMRKCPDGNESSIGNYTISHS